MCEANAYLINGDDKKLIMESVDIIEPEDNGVKIINIFGEQKFLNAKIRSLSLIDHNVLLEANQ
ncbi:MAG TPA: RNA-binding protein [Desulfobacteraceae bacterium]|nr:RNA-binding protein [Desulfobacteraceae bacterium]